MASRIEHLFKLPKLLFDAYGYWFTCTKQKNLPIAATNFPIPIYVSKERG
jgi:hypothetical protein